MPRQHLTPTRIAAFKPNVRAFLWDDEMPRLAVLARPTGTKTFVFKSTLNYRDILISLGSTGTRTIESAREEAWRYQRMIEAGDDPREVLKEQEEAAAAQEAAAKAAEESAAREAEISRHYTLRALCLAYADHLHAQGKVKTARDVKSAFNVHVFGHSDIADLPARDVTSHQIAAMVRKVREAGKERTAGILRNYLVAAFNGARRAPFDSGMSSELIKFEVTANPAEIVPAIAVNRGNRTLSSDELKGYILRLGDDGAGRALLAALLAGGQRMAQLLRAKVSDYDKDTQTLRLWDGKGKRATPREHALPLGPRADAAVKALAEQRGEADALVFDVSERTAGNRVAQISAVMGGEPFDLRDIRRTTETMLAGMGISRDTRAQLLSHGISGVQAAHYDRHSYTDEKRAALVAWEARLEEIETGKQAATRVVQLRGKAKAA